jgi:phenylalanyl-tRNA synthetase beta chain
VIDKNHFTGARNQRKLCFAHVSNTSSFEGIHGVIDTLMTLFGLNHEKDYYITASDNVSFFPGRQANLIVRGKNCGV